MAIGDIPGDTSQLKRRPGASSLPTGIGLTSEQLKANADSQWRQGAQQRQQQFKQGVADVAGGISNAIGTAARSAASIPQGIASGLANANVYDRPFDYSTPEKDAAKPGPTPQQQAGGIAAFDIAKRATDSAQMPFTAGIARGLLTNTLPKPAAPQPGPGIRPAGQQAVPGAGSQQVAPTAGAAQPQTSQAGIGLWGGTGIGRGAQGGEIVGRVNSQGIAEFSNQAPDQTAAAGRQFSAEGLKPQNGNVQLSQRPGMGLPGGAHALASGSSVPSGGEEFASLGSAANVGNGIGGGISYGQDGDARTAIARFDGANAEREKMVGIQRDLDAARGLTGVHGIDQPTSKTARQAEFDLRRREQDLRAGEVRRDQDLRADEARRRGIDAGLDRALRERELASTEQLNAARQQEIGLGLRKGRIELEQQQRLADLRAQLDDPNLDPMQRAAAERDYGAMSVGPTERYKADQEASQQRQKRITELFAAYSRLPYPPMDGVGKDAKPIPFEQWARPALQMMEQQGQARRTSVSMAEVEQAARSRGMTSDQIIQLLKARGVSVAGIR